jgi:EmrB/QacA subfamily drug resistance transporter
MRNNENCNKVVQGKFEKGLRSEITSLSADVTYGIDHTASILTTNPLPEEHQAVANKWAVLILAALSGFITNLDGSIVNIGLPAISKTFHVGVSGTIEWIIIGYLVVIAAVLLTFGRLADMIGRKPIFLTGLLVFVVGSALCGMAPTLLLLIFARLFQGLGGALIFSVNIAMITSAFPRNGRGLALGLNAVIVALGISAGPTIGGIITQYLTWRWIFYVNVPTCLIVLLAAFHFYREERPQVGQRGRFDPPGAVTFAISLALLTLGLSFGREWGWLSPGLLSVLSVGVVMLVVAIYIENRVEYPILDLNLLRNRTFAFANISFIFCMMALFAPGFIMPFYFEQLRGFSTIQTGLLMSPLPLTFAIMSPISGSVADRFGSRWLSPFGLAVACFGLFLLSQVNAQSSMGDIIWRLIIAGIGQGIFQSPNTRTMMGAAPSNAQGEASGLLATGRVIGQSLGVAIMGTIFAGLGGAAAGNILFIQSHNFTPQKIHALQDTFVHSFHWALLSCSLLAALGIFTALARGQGAGANQSR